MRSQYVDSISLSGIACILVVFVGIWSFCNSIIPRNGCRRLAKSTHFEAENHAVSVILQVAQLLEHMPGDCIVFVQPVQPKTGLDKSSNYVTQRMKPCMRRGISHCCCL